MRFRTIPNGVTLLRALLAPLALWAQQSESFSGLVTCLVLLTVAEVTDGLDGYLARRTGQVSNVGKLLDPLADSMFRMLIFLGFMASGWMPLWMVAIVFARDILVAYLRVLAGLLKVVLAARVSGKIKAIVQGGAQFFVVGCYALDALGMRLPAAEISWWLLLVATCVTAWSAVDYAQHVLRVAHAKKKEREEAADAAVAKADDALEVLDQASGT